MFFSGADNRSSGVNIANRLLKIIQNYRYNISPSYSKTSLSKSDTRVPRRVVQTPFTNLKGEITSLFFSFFFVEKLTFYITKHNK